MCYEWCSAGHGENLAGAQHSSLSLAIHLPAFTLQESFVGEEVVHSGLHHNTLIISQREPGSKLGEGKALVSILQ